mgnify:CR=1 FL=1
MNRIKRIAPFVELAETKEKQAVQAYGMRQQKLDEARKALNSLRSFRIVARIEEEVHESVICFSHLKPPAIGYA